MDTQNLWLGSLPWEKVQTANESLCKQQNTAFQAARSYDTARQFWGKSAVQPMSLEKALDVCRRCCEMAPFTFNNGNTFASLGKALVDDWLQTLAPLDAQILRNTVGHYIAGLISKRELTKVLRHFDTSWKAYTAARQSVPKLPLIDPVPQRTQA